MASNLTRIPILRAVQIRPYSVAASVPINGIQNYEVQTKTLSNNVELVAADNNAAICRLSVLFKAGSRYENHDNAGITHMLRISAGLSTKRSSQFAIARNIQELGGGLSCSTDREIVAYTLEGTRAAVEELLPFLTDVVSQQDFFPWEVSDNIPRIRLDLATRPPQQRAIDLLHKAAFRTGLGNSIYMAKHQIGKISTEHLQHYVAENFLSGRTAVVGYGLDIDTVARFATGLELKHGEGKHEQSPFKGGEIRSDKGGNSAYIAIATEGVKGGDLKSALAYGILKKIWGTSQAVRPWGGISTGLMSRTNSLSSATKGFSINYSDTGLIGAIIACEASEAGKKIEETYKILKSGSVTDNDIVRGKNQLKRSVLSNSESGSEAGYRLGVGTLIGGKPYNSYQIADAIEALNAADVKAAAQKVASGHLAIASVGNLRTVPFLNDIH